MLSEGQREATAPHLLAVHQPLDGFHAEVGEFDVDEASSLRQLVSQRVVRARLQVRELQGMHSRRHDPVPGSSETESTPLAAI